MKNELFNKEPLLEIKDLKVKFPGRKKVHTAVDGVNLTIHPGEIVGVVGESGSGKSVMSQSILRLREYDSAVGYEGEILWDTSKPNGTPRKLLDVSKAERLGWKYRTELEEGIRLSYADFLSNPMRAER